MISIVIPVYNAEKYLLESIDSLLRQIYQDWEAVLINDGSTDRSGEICREFSEKDNRIRSIEQINQGVSAARNRGKMECAGEYICFMDSDDSILNVALERMLKVAQQTKADIVICDYQKVNNADDIIYECSSTNKPESITSEEAIKLFLLEKKIGSSACTKLFRKETIEKVFFDVNRKMNEDKFFVFEALMNSHVISVIDQKLYCYYTRNNSATQKPFNAYWFDCQFFARKIYGLICELRPEFEIEARYQMLSSLYFLIRLMDRENVVSIFQNEYSMIIADIKQTSIVGVRKLFTRNRFRGIILIKYLTPIYRLINR